MTVASSDITSKHHHALSCAQRAPLTETPFTIELQFNLKGGILEINGGHINAKRVGSCEFEGTLNYSDLTVADKNLGLSRYQDACGCLNRRHSALHSGKQLLAEHRQALVR